MVSHGICLSTKQKTKRDLRGRKERAESFSNGGAQNRRYDHSPPSVCLPWSNMTEDGGKERTGPGPPDVAQAETNGRQPIAHRTYAFVFYFQTAVNGTKTWETNDASNRTGAITTPMLLPAATRGWLQVFCDQALER